MLFGSITINLLASDSESMNPEIQVEDEFSEDQQSLSVSHLHTSVDFSQYRPGKSWASNRYLENTSELSKSKAYYSENRFIKPGLDLSDIIFPFHFFL